MKRATLLLALSLAGCVSAGQGFMRPRSVPAGADAHNPCATLKQMYSINAIYPRAALSVKQDGWVLLKYDVSGGGVPFNITVQDSSPPGVFDQASLDALAQWRYARKEFPTRDCFHLDAYAAQ